MATDTTHIRDRLLRDTFTIAERIVYYLILCTALTTFWVGAPYSKWLLGALIIVGSLSIFILKTHEHTHPFFVDLLWPKFWIITAPMWWLILQFLFGLTQHSTSSIELYDTEWISLNQPSNWFPVSNADGNTWIRVFSYGAMYLLAMTLFIVPKSRAFFERMLPCLCLGATLVGLFGFIQLALELDRPMFTTGTGGTDFFAFFPYDGHWAAFAILWSAVSFSLALAISKQTQDSHYLNSKGPWYLAAGSLLGLSGFWLDAALPAACLLITYSILLGFASIHFIRISQDKDRKLIASGTAIVGLIAGFSGCMRIIQFNGFSESATRLRSAGIEMFSDRPLWGWGLNGFEKILPFYANDQLLPGRYQSAHSDLIQCIAELGIFGLAPAGILFAALIIRYILGQHDFHLTNYLLFGCISLLILACFDNPFLSPAVFFSFWILFFSALRWADLSRNKIDEVDARTIVVSHESERKVPIYDGPYKDSQK